MVGERRRGGDCGDEEGGWGDADGREVWGQDRLVDDAVMDDIPLLMTRIEYVCLWIDARC